MEVNINRAQYGTYWKWLTLVAVWTTTGQWTSLSSGTSPVWAAGKAPSWLQSLEECLSAWSKFSSWLPGPGDPLKTDTAEKTLEVLLNRRSETDQPFNKRISRFRRSCWLNIYSQRSWTPVCHCNSFHDSWSLPLNTSGEREITKYICN